MIEFKNVSYENNGEIILNNISFTIKKNEFKNIKCKNDKEKSAIINLIVGLEKVKKGEILIEGEKIKYDKNSLFEIRKKIGVVFNEIEEQLIGETVLDNFIFIMENNKLSREEMQKNIKKYSEIFEIEKILNKKINELSENEKQKIVIISVILVNPKVIVIDEILENIVDEKFKQILNKYIEDEKTIVSISCNLKKVKKENFEIKKNIKSNRFLKKSFINLHNLDPRSKMLSTLLLLILIISSNSFFEYILITIFLFVLIIISRLDILKILSKLKSFLFIFIVIFLFNIFFMNSGELLFDLKFIKIYSKAVIFTTNTFFQIFLLTTVMEIFTFTTDSIKIMKAINYILNKKNKNSEIALLFMISLQFIPIIQEELKKIMADLKSRGVNIKKEIFLIIISLFQTTINKVNKISKILRVKNFILDGEKTEFEPLKWKKWDTIYVIINFIFIIIFIILKTPF